MNSSKVLQIQHLPVILCTPGIHPAHYARHVPEYCGVHQGCKYSILTRNNCLGIRTSNKHDDDREDLLLPGIPCNIPKANGGEGGAGEVHGSQVGVHLAQWYYHILLTTILALVISVLLGRPYCIASCSNQPIGISRNDKDSKFSFPNNAVHHILWNSQDVCRPKSPIVSRILYKSFCLGRILTNFVQKPELISITLSAFVTKAKALRLNWS